jgi:hypothetical protein
MIEMLSGALLFSYFIAGIHFCRFWRRTGDRLFLHFAAAFWLFALNQLATSIPAVANETAGYEYLLTHPWFHRHPCRDRRQEPHGQASIGDNANCR